MERDFERLRIFDGQRYSYRVKGEGTSGPTHSRQGIAIAQTQQLSPGVNPFMEQPNLVRIGKKPIMNYVVACVTLFNSGAEEVMVRARGQAISKAVDAVLMLRDSFLKDLEIESIEIGSEEVTRLDGSRGSISTIEILLGK